MQPAVAFYKGRTANADFAVNKMIDESTFSITVCFLILLCLYERLENASSNIGYNAVRLQGRYFMVKYYYTGNNCMIFTKKEKKKMV